MPSFCKAPKPMWFLWCAQNGMHEYPNASELGFHPWSFVLNKLYRECIARLFTCLQLRISTYMSKKNLQHIIPIFVWAVFGTSLGFVGARGGWSVLSKKRLHCLRPKKKHAAPNRRWELRVKCMSSPKSILILEMQQEHHPRQKHARMWRLQAEKESLAQKDSHKCKD